MGAESDMEFTGERYVPALAGQIKYEHLHRYALAAEFARGKSVLDVASGEGYGSALLARVASSVTGVDISAESVEHASRAYYYRNLEFLVGGCHALPLPDHSVQVVTSFETIEHHDRHEEMMSEIKRVLEPGGVLIISSPNRLVYSDIPKQQNPFHVKELYFAEFRRLLECYFKHVQIYGQRLALGSFTYQLQETNAQQYRSYTGDIEHLTPRVGNLPDPVYFIAVCSDEPLLDPHSCNSIYIDAQDDLLKFQLQDSTEKLKQSELLLRAENRRSAELEEQLRVKAAQIVEKDSHIRDLGEFIAKSAAEVEAKDELIGAYELALEEFGYSGSYRLGRALSWPFRFAKRQIRPASNGSAE